MKPAQVGALVGGFLGLLSILFYKVVVVSSALVTALLWPARSIMTALNGHSPFGHMLLDTLSVFANILIYAAVGYGIGSLIPSTENQR